MPDKDRITAQMTALRAKLHDVEQQEADAEGRLPPGEKLAFGAERLALLSEIDRLEGELEKLNADKGPITPQVP